MGLFGKRRFRFNRTRLRDLRKALADNDQIIEGGWQNDEKAKSEFLNTMILPRASQNAQALVGSSEGKTGMLWKAWEKQAGQDFEPHFQKIGDCVSQGGALGVETLSAVEIGLGQREEWCNKISTEVLYGGSRVEIGGGRIKGDGSTGSWLARFVEDYGSVKRGQYGDIDLTTYDPDLAKAWGKSRSKGIPVEMEELATEHPVGRAVLIDGGWNQACDLMANGCPVVICSSIGYQSKADREGFLRAGPTWQHCMLLWGFDRKSRREGGCIANSWGEGWFSGPEHALGTPAGCFWAEARDINRMLREGDSYAFVDYKGFIKRDLDYDLFGTG